MSLHSVFGRRFHFPIRRRVSVTLSMLAALAWSNPAFCDKNRDTLEAAKDHNLAKVQALLKNNPKLVFSTGRINQTALHEAALGGRKNVAEFLRQRGGQGVASPTQPQGRDVSTPIQPTPPQGQATTTQSNAGSPICDAVRNGDFERIKTLLQSDPALVFSKDEYGATALHWAAQTGQKDVAEFLLARKAEVNTKDSRGVTPLHLAAFNGHKDLVELLLANKAELNAKDNNGGTPLHRAVQNGHKDVAELLRQHGGQDDSMMQPLPARALIEDNRPPKKSRLEIPTNELEAVSVLRAFFKHSYISCKTELDEARLTNTAGRSRTDAALVSRVLLRSCFQHHKFSHIFGLSCADQPYCGNFKTFVSIDEAGYEFTWEEGGSGLERFHPAGAFYDIERNFYFISDDKGTAQIKFADITQIKALSQRSFRQGAGEVKLLGDTGSSLDIFHFSRSNDRKPVLAAFKILCKNLK